MVFAVLSDLLSFFEALVLFACTAKSKAFRLATPFQNCIREIQLISQGESMDGHGVHYSASQGYYRAGRRDMRGCTSARPPAGARLSGGGVSLCWFASGSAYWAGATPDPYWVA